MLLSYLKTTLRNVLKNKQFSLINILGLAISMSVGLLIISLLADLNAYDDFHQKSNRIYRVITKQEFNNGRNWVELASTSLKAGKRIQELDGLENLTILHRNFGGEVEFDGQLSALYGFWATESFFQTFSFPLIQGDPKTALRNPNSLVLTENTAKRIFGELDPMGKTLNLKGSTYVITGILESIPQLSHLRFEALASYRTLENLEENEDGGFLDWSNIYSNYIYLVLPNEIEKGELQERLNAISQEENVALKDQEISLDLQPLEKIVLGKSLRNPVGPNLPIGILLVLGILVLIVILSACFNYTNLSIAGSIKRFEEVGIRKVFGAGRKDIFRQFIFESIIIALLALVLSLVIFGYLRPHFLALHPEIANTFKLQVSAGTILYFLGFAILVGGISGIIPALFFLLLDPIKTLQNVSAIKIMKRVTVRKALIVIQFVFTTIFISITLLGYNQYKFFLAFDLGFETENILNIRVSGKNAEHLKNELTTLKDVKSISSSAILMSLGNKMGCHLKYENPNDSLEVYFNWVDENYLTVFNHQLLAGQNFREISTTEGTGVIINEQVLDYFFPNISNPNAAIGEIMRIENQPVYIEGVVKDFHHEGPEKQIKPFIFRYGKSGQYLNLALNSPNLPKTMKQIEAKWKRIDPYHPLNAQFYDERIEQSYQMFTIAIRIVGVLAFLSIVVASLGLFGMVVSTMNTRMKEISIRKVFGATSNYLVFLLSREFLILLLFAVIIALPISYLLFNKLILIAFANHAPFNPWPLLLVLFILANIALLTIGIQAGRTVGKNPAEVLRDA